MRKILVSIIISLALLLTLYGLFKYNVSLSVKSAKQTDALAVSEANVEKGKEAKRQGEAATQRADESKSEVRKNDSAVKERIREKFTSLDDEPLPDDVVNELCIAYSYSDCVRDATGKPIAGNKG